MSFAEEKEAALRGLEEKLGHRFAERALLLEALTHPSYVHEHPEFGLSDNQRLEFLGDSVLGLSISRLAFSLRPPLSEGQMTRLRAAVVCESSLADCALKLGLADCLFLGKGESKSSGVKASVLADAMESLFAAIFLDASFAEAEACVLRLLRPYADLALAGRLTADYKTTLIEHAQKQPGHPCPVYEIIETSGPVHARVFVARVSLLGKSAEGSGPSKKQAEQQASKRLLDML